MKLPFLNNKLEKSFIDLPELVLSKSYNNDLTFQYARVYLSNQRQGTSSTKTKGEVRGGGKKPWRQKGTNRARQGSIRSPHWVGGGVAHGPKPKDWRLKITSSMKRKVFLSVFLQKANENRIFVVDFAVFKKPGTKKVYELLKEVIKEDMNKGTVVVLTSGEKNLIKSLRNINNVKTKDVSSVSSFDILQGYIIILTAQGFDNIKSRLVSKPIKIQS